jgi:hypothetical protein
VASKHWTCRQNIDLHGRSIRSVDSGHLSDKTVAVVTMSVSRDLLTTMINVLSRRYPHEPQYSLSLMTASLVIRRPTSSLFASSDTGTTFTT